LGHVELNIILPLGISFYTFQTMSYTIDVYRKKYKPYDSFLDFCLYVSFFPQLIAGPIVRADCFGYQLERPRHLHWSTFYHGTSRFIFGVFKKVVLANQASAFADAVFASPSEYSGFMCAIGVYAFAFQIYFDFSGYTDMALGLMTLMGFTIPENFDHPYEAASIREFWQKWHISLSTWLRDYLYIPLGGSKISTWNTYRNLFITFGLGGLWHGAGWNFFIWGMLHGTYLTLERLIRGHRFDRVKNPLLDTLLVVFTFHLVCFSWVFFRAETFQKAREMLVQICDPSGFFVPAEIGLFKPQNWAIGIILPFLVLVFTRFHKIDKSLRSYHPLVAVSIVTAMLVTIALITGGANEFIYFQF
jgi:D-alanyl-lipoteichoic acid acyltransferase DltB (MBOAT superfamily)